MTKSQYEKLHWAQKRFIVRLVKAGGVVMCEMHEGTPFFSIRSSGKEIDRTPVKKMIASGFLIASDDGLFEGESQTYMVRMH